MIKKKILVIDDEKDFCALFKRNLESTKEYEVTTAYSGEDGLEKAKEINFDLVITDFKMPGINGKTVMDILKKTKPDLPVVLFSIYHDDPSTIRTSERNKADGLISKTVDSEQLYKTIKDILAKREK